MTPRPAPLKAAILVVSTSAAKDPSADASGLTLCGVLDEAGGRSWDVAEPKIVSDSVAQIQRQIMLWTDAPDPVHLIVTTGGTGFAESDITPEAVSALLHKQAPGLVHGMLATSLAATPFAMMSRPVAGVRHRTVVVTLPGSPKGARENLQAIVKTLPHACEQAAGADSRSLHAGGLEKLEREAGIEGAQGTQASANPVLAEDVRSQVSVPAFRASIVDGYAVVVPKHGSMKGVFPVVSVSHAAPGGVEPLKEGEIARITTEDGREEKEVEILADEVQAGENVREVGSDIEKGATVLRKGQRISSVGGEIGVLAAVGVAKIRTYRRPVVGVLSTGDELVDHDRPGDLRLGEVRDTNRPTLLSAIRGWGFEAQDLGIGSDKPGALEETLRDGLRKTDIVITTGGVSMGELDLLKPTIERALGGSVHFGRVAMKPGKPTTFATASIKNSAGERVLKTIFSLPGNPASALVTFHLFVLPSLHQMSGVAPPGLPKISVELSHDFAPDKQRVEYHQAVVTVTRDGILTATSTVLNCNLVLQYITPRGPFRGQTLYGAMSL
ncbi:hypothetical protein P8C59_005568 [Phyllachora maydis]|uniref:MoaB/Mog domain-containing protein n=1 Tax=Phyllachora maydis TaxID=1825666 RepID=A0AAD9MEM2_9PEZI|nr:hypothetical protein P8C59_005568 [Phyllachora maydis]